MTINLAVVEDAITKYREFLPPKAVLHVISRPLPAALMLSSKLVNHLIHQSVPSTIPSHWGPSKLKEAGTLHGTAWRPQVHPGGREQGPDLR